MKQKEGVSIKGIQPEVIYGLLVAETVFTETGYDLIITSICDSKHGVNSLHYKGLAFDLRSKHLPTEIIKKYLLECLKKCFGKEWDVILEDLGGDNEHYHLEFDPKVNS